MDNNEIEFRRNGSRISITSQSESNNVWTFSGPNISGSVNVDASDNLVIRFEQVGGYGYELTVDDEQTVLSAETCVCSTAGGQGPVQGTCTTTQCDTAHECDFQQSKFCNWRELGWDDL